MYLSWKYLPGNVSKITGLFNTFFGLGAFVFTYVASMYVNSDYLEPSIVTYNKEHLYPPEVSDKVPDMLRFICYCWTGLLIISVAILPGFKKEDQHA